MQTIEIIYKQLPLTVKYTFIKGEPMVRYYKDGSGYPGSGDEVDIYGAYHCGEDISNFIDELARLDLDPWYEIEELILEKINNELYSS